MAYLRNKIDMRIALLGITGTGKSTLGNGILGKNVFKTSGSGRSETEVCKVDKRQHDGRQIMVVDTPGFFDTEMTFAQFQEKLIPFLDKTSPGPHVIFFLTRAERFTDENNRAVLQFCETFGDAILRHTIVVFTHLNSDTSEQEYLSGLQKNLKCFLDKCNNRLLFMPQPNNTAETSTKIQQLLNMADELITENNGICYTDEMYRAQEKLIKEKLEEQARLKREEEEEKLNAVKREISAEYNTQIEALRNDVNLSKEERREKQELVNQLMERMKNSDEALKNMMNTITAANQKIAELSSRGTRELVCVVQ